MKHFKVVCKDCGRKAHLTDEDSVCSAECCGEDYVMAHCKKCHLTEKIQTL